jgi:cytochrome c peroxidase
VENALLLPTPSANYASPTLPPNFLVPPIINQDDTPATNAVSDAGATLGRVLFYDKRLSTNQTISCSSCHQREHGFADPRRFSTGFNGGQTARNAMGLTNARWYLRRHFFWDERANTLEDQVLMPIQNSVEMGMTLDTLVSRLSAEPFYTNLFNNAFGSPEVTSTRISLALAQFVRSIISTRSKYDQGIPIGFSNFTPEENLGRQLFFGQVGVATCAACHGTDNFVPGPAINNNGLEYPYVDKGLGGITGIATDNGKFKVPSLRNIELTAPYMHDGRFATLEEVVEFYNSGVVDNPNLSPPLRVRTGPGQPPGPPLRLNLTTAQKAALVAFLKTLTDTSVTTDPKFSDPFNYGN